MKNHTLHFFMLFTFIVFVYASVIQGTAHGKEAIKFSTQQTRELWQMCSVSFRTRHPGVTQGVYYPVCDCYVDHIRKHYKPEVLEVMTPEESSKLAQGLRDACNPKNLKEEDFT